MKKSKFFKSVGKFKKMIKIGYIYGENDDYDVFSLFPEILKNFDFFTSIPPSMKNRKNGEKFFLDFQKSAELESFTLLF